MAEGQKASGGGNANPENAVSTGRTYARPVTRNVVSQRTMKYRPDSAYWAAEERARDLYAKSVEPNATAKSEERRLRNYQRIRKARDNMQAKAKAVWDGTHTPTSWNDLATQGDIVGFLDDWNKKRGSVRVTRKR